MRCNIHYTKYLATVCHGENARVGVLHREVLVGKGGPGVDGHAARPVAVHEVPSL